MNSWSFVLILIVGLASDMTSYNLNIERNKSTGANTGFNKLFRMCHLYSITFYYLLMLCDSFGGFMIKEDQFKDLTLTYDFEAEVAKIKRTVSV
ncbi:MAG: hypothetical protein MUC49_22880 [Raineya sp.]|nr:hypothetical protein [Raineya sp.]